MPINLAMSAADYSSLVAMLPANLVVPFNGLHYDGANVTAPDGDLTTAINAIIADPNWKANAAKAQLKAYAATARYNKETGGTKVNGVSYPTDRETQAKLTGAYNLAQANPGISIDWKLPDGTFTTLTAAQVQGIATAVGNFVQQCFGAEAAIVVGITNGTITTTAQIDAQLATF